MSDLKGAGFSPYLHTRTTDYHDWLRGFQYRIPVILTGGASGMGIGVQLKLDVPYDVDMRNNFDDIRFTGQNGTTLIDAWLEDKTDGVDADIWIEPPITPATGEKLFYYMYFGNKSVGDYWNGEATFLQFFDGDSTGWIEVDPNSHITFQNNRLEFAGLSRSESAYVYKTITPMEFDWIAEWVVNISVSENTGHVFSMGISSEIDDLYSHSGDSVGVDHNYGSAINHALHIWEVDNGVATTINTSGASAPNTRYMRAYRIGNMMYCVAYSDVDRTVEIETTISKDITGVIAANLDNYFLLSSLHATGDAIMSGYVDDHICRKYMSGPPTYLFGAKERY